MTVVSATRAETVRVRMVWSRAVTSRVVSTLVGSLNIYISFEREVVIDPRGGSPKGTLLTSGGV